MAALEALLQEHFGFITFRPGQKQLAAAVLAGEDALGILPTGSGKTLCYQLPATQLSGLMVIVEPLLALMDDQVARLQARGQKRAVALSSRLTPPAFHQVLASLARYRFLFVAPETLMRQDVLHQLQQVTISCLVIDEAHCISQWGPDFRPAYLQLGQARAALKPRCTLALTATAPKRVRADIIAQLGLQDPQQVVSDVDRPNVYLGVEQIADPAAKQARAKALVQAVQAATIVYFDSKAQAEAYAEMFTQAGIAAAYYHAGLLPQARELIQRQFMHDQLQVICATSAFGMGIDKPDIRLVVYTYVPESLAAYSQGIGRAGRDGQPSISVVLVAPGDMQRAAQFAQALPDNDLIQTVYADPEAYQDFDDPQVQLLVAYHHAGFAQATVVAQLAARRQDKQAHQQAMAQFLTAKGCRRQVWLQYFDSPIKPHTAYCCGVVTPEILAQIPHKPINSAKAQDWRQVFAQLFNQV
ncbi:RecQ family ATP-dependent DNA helicase [Lacticaseibacillus baoqingensis]|uniref:RecQ family ATP-dependent DNA helicase n=1 Tax=Lacticaseibacillus baoqingensis TaxID=2486013 RepID=A0ABW4EAK6_9LACO|nr:RecQ family ATP-dependent DNA helicase [Lacticaseibacillus baoqingensis]